MVEDRDQVVVLHGITWEQYEAIDRARCSEAPQPRFAYLDGELQILTTGRPRISPRS